MDKPQDPEAAETVQTKEIPAVDLPQIVRRLGRFRVSEYLVKTHPEEVMKVMAECLVVRCELKYETMTFNYVAISRWDFTNPRDSDLNFLKGKTRVHEIRYSFNRTMSACTTASGGARRSRGWGCSYGKSSKQSGW